MLKVILLALAILAGFALAEFFGGLFATAIGVIFFAGSLAFLSYLFYWFIKRI